MKQILSAAEKRNLAIQEVYKKAAQLFGSKAEFFLAAPRRELDNQSPKEVIAAGHPEVVLNLLVAIEECLP